MFSLLPTSLLALLLASPALTAPMTPNDPFHDLAVLAPKQPQDPICCLRPLSPLEPPADEDILLSFEDWKARRLSDAKEREATPPTSGRAENLSESTVAPESSQTPPKSQGSPYFDVHDGSGSQERLEPHFRIPITDRFNYASLDCSARVHAAHKSAKSASSILSHKKDRYMLSPCSEKTQYVIVELCEDIRIDTVQLANFEFFSGVFKDFSVSVAKTYTTNLEEWTPAGTFRGQNVRGVQSFHPPPTLRDFYRFIRVDFHSHYGNEYYCPVSLLRVYGLTHLDAWQWETWEAESRAKRSAEEASSPVEVVADAPAPARTPVIHSEDAEVTSQTIVEDDSSSSSDIPVTSDILDSLQYNIYTSSGILDIPKSPEGATVHGQESTTPAKPLSDDPTHDSARPQTDHLYNTHVSLSTSTHVHSTTSDNYSTSIYIDSHSDSASHAPPHSSHSSSSIRSSTATPNASSISTSSASHVPPPAPPASTGGESIYRTIMNRLTALEGSTTLYARYVEEQTAGMREVLRRLTEDIGRLEGIGKAQSQLWQRSVVELEKQTRRLEDEQRELLHRVNYLTDEVVLEKRLGIAQLCLLLTVLVFMALTRGSRGEYARPPGARSVREWGRRTFSFSGGLVNRLRTGSPTPARAVDKNSEDNDVLFPSVASQASDDLPRPRRAPAAGTSRKTIPRPHTPTAIRTPTSRHFAHRAGNATSPSHHAFGPRPQMQRSGSGSMTLGFGGIGPVPKSAKRWARTAHLHEVKLATPRRQKQTNGDNTPVPSASGSDTAARDTYDVDASNADDANAQFLVLPAAIDRSETITLGTLGRGKGRMVAGSLRQSSPLRPAAVIDLSSPPLRSRRLAPSESDASEGDAWVDTDVDGSECDSVVDAGPEGVFRERTSVANSSM